MRKVSIQILAILLVFSFMPTVNGHNDSLKILLFVGNYGDGHHYDLGDTVPVEVRVFDNGQPTDSDEPPTVTLNPFVSNDREITVVKNDIGVYTGSFTLTENDVRDDYTFSISANATLGKESIIDISYDDDTSVNSVCSVSRESSLVVDINFDDFPMPPFEASPGDTLDMTITVEDSKVKVNPDSFNLTADGDPLQYTNPDIGVFEASYTVSSTTSEDTTISIEAEAEYYDKESYSIAYIEVNFYSIWYHRIEVTDTYSQFELFISDMEGNAVSGAEINFDYHGFGDDGSKSGITDSPGKASFTIEYDSASNIWIDGTIDFLGKTQNFEGGIAVDYGSEEPTSWSSFDVICQDDRNDISTGESVILNYIAYEEGEPIPNQRIIYYIYSGYGFLKSGSTTTDSNGKFVVPFTTPVVPSSITLAFESPFEKKNSWEHADSDDDFVYREDVDWVSILSDDFEQMDENIEITTESFTIGGKAKITARMPDLKDYYGFAEILPSPLYPENFEDISNREWVSWSNPEWSDYSFFLFYVEEEDEVTREVLLPEFLPSNVTYTLVIYFANGSSIRWNYLHISPSENGGDEDGGQDDHPQSPFNIGGIGLPYIAIIILIVIILMVVAFVIKRRRTKRKAL